MRDDRQRSLVGIQTPLQRLAEVKAQTAEMDLAVRLGKLIDAEDVSLTLSAAFASLGSGFDSTLDQLARRHGWSEAVRFDAGEVSDAARREFVAKASEPPCRGAGANPPEEHSDPL